MTVGVISAVPSDKHCSDKRPWNGSDVARR